MKKLLLLLIVPVLGFGQGEQRYAEGTATDQDGNTFELIKYGTQDWAIENAEVVTYRDGTPILQVIDGTEWKNITKGAWCYYDNDPTKGKLYNWYAVMGIHDDDESTPNKEFAPNGWHVPTDAEFYILEQYLITEGYNWDGSYTDDKIGKSMASTTGWNNHNEEGNIGNEQSSNNKSGFNAYPVGRRDPQYVGAFLADGVEAYFWCAQGTSFYKDLNQLTYSNHILYSNLDHMQNGFSVRFVRDASNDTDGDGATNNTDNCPNTPIGETVDGNGCSDSQKDTDSDGITDDLDQCSETPIGETVDGNGCSDSQKDTDSDGITDDLDQCSETPIGETVDGNGCSDSQLLSTNDYSNAITAYPNPTTSIVNLKGDKQYDIEVYNLQGKKVMALTGNTIDMSHLSSATYIVKALDKVDNEEVSYKVVKN
jgi:uncharacterized protein (TIGR02145 family)